ncbi:hypothetical protein ACU610_25230 [Geodermatophilus sp. URMC 61]
MTQTPQPAVLAPRRAPDDLTARAVRVEGLAAGALVAARTLDL